MVFDETSRGYKMLLLLLAVFSHTVNSRPPGKVKALSEMMCNEVGRNIYEVFTGKWCCKCGIGEVKVKDCQFGNPTTTACERCIFDLNDPNKQFYMDTENNSTQCKKSIVKQNCLKKMNTRFFPGSNERASRCVCKDGYYSSSDVMLYGCNKHSVCDPGYYPVIIGTNVSDTKCTNCPLGTFSDESSATALCKPFTKCQPGEDVIEGTSIRDVRCNVTGNITSSSTASETLLDTTQEFPETEAFSFKQLIFLIAVVSLGISAIALSSFCIYKCCTCAGTKVHEDPFSLQEHQLKSEEKFIPNLAEEGAKVRKYKSHSGASDQVSMKKESTKFGKVRYQKAQYASEDGTVDLQDSRKDSSETLEKLQNKKRQKFSGDKGGVAAEIITLIEKMGIVNLTVKSTNWKKVVHDLLNNSDIGHEMLKGLSQFSSEDIRCYIENLLGDTEITDVEKDYMGNQSEIRYQWLLYCIRKHGRKLTPMYLLGTEFDKGIFPKTLRDSMLDIVVSKIKKILSEDKSPKKNLI